MHPRRCAGSDARSARSYAARMMQACAGCGNEFESVAGTMRRMAASCASSVGEVLGCCGPRCCWRENRRARAFVGAFGSVLIAPMSLISCNTSVVSFLFRCWPGRRRGRTVTLRCVTSKSREALWLEAHPDGDRRWVCAALGALEPRARLHGLAATAGAVALRNTLREIRRRRLGRRLA